MYSHLLGICSETTTSNLELSPTISFIAEYMMAQLMQGCDCALVQLAHSSVSYLRRRLFYYVHRRRRQNST